MIRITIKIPNPIPALKISPITSQLVNEISTIVSTKILFNIFFIVFCFSFQITNLRDCINNSFIQLKEVIASFQFANQN